MVIHANTLSLAFEVLHAFSPSLNDYNPVHGPLKIFSISHQGQCCRRIYNRPRTIDTLAEPDVSREAENIVWKPDRLLDQ